MNIIVCIKQVPDTGSVKINPETNTLIRTGVPSIINPFDMNAVEAGLALRDGNGGKVSVITMGPPQAEEALRETMAMGVDNAYLLSDRAFAGADTLATSYTLSMAIRLIIDFDLILCGKQAIDGDTAQVGPELAEILGIPQVTNVSRLIEVKDTTLIVEQELEDGCKIIEVERPCLITVTKEVNKPRLPSLKNSMRAKKAEIPIWGANDINADEARLGLKGSATQVVKIFEPLKRTDSRMLKGDVEEMVTELVAELRKRVTR
ncbi:electron transfer flavoprotein subunit beta [Candidatus Desantisbacteria bacterium CG2_30_40_21]|uniref:Electron transfer flavoprotein subunit beta n=1 Tax=Candidatus Desantisbacteria bacterium CG2_30_40_21 TaxID=1817895 RepID=A0A1J5DLN2_9BACT|nr:MAG: electron transfer flavoprotein subunit beta [Candidatus Desantisbacteria bacterium CG2_30_40_21]